MELDPATMLREHGIYVTAQRLAVLRAVNRQPHITADEVLQVVRGEIGTISRQSVYDTVNTLTDRGLLRRIQPTGSPARYEDRTGDNHHHLICRGCGRVVDVDCAVGARPCLTASHDHGFTIDEAEVLYWGQCPACRAGRSDPTDPANQPTRDTPDSNQPSRTITSNAEPSRAMPNHHEQCRTITSNAEPSRAMPNHHEQ